MFIRAQSQCPTRLGAEVLMPTLSITEEADFCRPALVRLFLQQALFKLKYNKYLAACASSILRSFPLRFTIWAWVGGSSANGNFSRSSYTIPAAVFSPVWEINELEWSYYALSLSVKLLSNKQNKTAQSAI